MSDAAWHSVLFCLLTLVFAVGFLSRAHAACSDPSANAGDIIYNAPCRVVQYCDGNDDWIAMGPIGGASDLTAGLVGWWKLDESSGNAADSSGYGHTGTLQVFPVWQPSGGKDGGALDLERNSSQHVSITTTAALAMNGGAAVTLSAWINAESIPGGCCNRIVSMPGNEPAGSEHYALLLSNNTLQFWIGGVPNDRFISVPYSATGSWHHVAGVYNGENVALYIDGDLVEIQGIDGPVMNNNDGSALQIGTFGPNWGQYFDGLIDDVRIYNRALGWGEIVDLYESTGGSFSLPACGTTKCGGQAGERVVFAIDTGAITFGGITGADSRCQSTAFNAGLAGAYKAWIADSNASSAPATRFEHSSVPYVRVNGTQVADGWSDLTDGSLDADMKMDETGGTSFAANYVATNVASNGTQYSAVNHCTNWTVIDASSARGGDMQDTTGGDWTQEFSVGCDWSKSIYCFEQPGDPLYELSGSGFGCAGPDGEAGDLMYNAQWRTVQYCEGSSWVATGPRFYTANGVYFDGANDYLTRGADLSSNGDDKTFTGSFWFRRGATGGTQVIYSNTSSRFQISFNTSNRLRLQATNTSGATRLDITADTQMTDSDWHHVMFSIDMAQGCANGTSTGPGCFVYLDGAAETINVATFTDSTLDFTRTNHALAATTAGGSKYTGALADFWLEFRVYTDLSAAGERAKFYNAGNPVHLGADGSLPMGSAPDVFFSGDRATWHTNDGTGGGFTLNGGGLDDGGNTAGTGTVDVTAGLVAHLKFDESAGNAADATGNGNTGIIAGNPVWQPAGGMVGGALEFDGSDDEVILDGYTDLDFSQENAFTIAAWIYPGTGSTFGTVISRGAVNSSADGEIFWLRRYSSGARWQARISDGTNQLDIISADGSLDVEAWQHVVVTWDGTTLNLYKNNSPLGSDSGGTFTGLWNGDNAADRATSIGSEGSDGDDDWEGLIDDMRIYDRVLSAAEVQQLYLYNGIACANPERPEGTILYNTDENVVQYCNGVGWVRMGR